MRIKSVSREHSKLYFHYLFHHDILYRHNLSRIQDDHQEEWAALTNEDRTYVLRGHGFKKGAR